MKRAELKAWARSSLAGNWGLAIGVIVVETVILEVLGWLLGLVIPDVKQNVMGIEVSVLSATNLVSLLLTGAFEVGIVGVFLTFLRKDQEPKIVQMFDGFQNFVAALVANVLVSILVSVGTVVLIVPGIILSLMLSQTFYLLRDQPELGAVGAMKASAEMMKGHKGEYFVLQLSFIPWMLLCALIIPAFYVIPYMSATMAAYYEHLKAELNEGAEPQEPSYNLGDPERFSD